MSVLEFISSLKWPFVVLVALLVMSRALRKSPGLGEWARSWLDKRDVRGKVGPAEFEATASQAAVEQAAAVTAASDEELAAIVAAEPQQEAPDTAPASQPDVSVMRRENVESLLRASAQWGWEMAQMGFRTPPDPHVQWTEDGRPEILYGAGTPITRALVVPSSWALTPDEVRRRAAAAGEPQISDAARQAAIQRRLDELRHGESDDE